MAADATYGFGAAGAAGAAGGLTAAGAGGLATGTPAAGTAGLAPGAAGAALVEAIVRDEKKLFPCCVSLEGEYGQNDICIGVPVIIGKNGWEKIVDYNLNEEEKAAFAKSADAVRNMNSVLATLDV